MGVRGFVLVKLSCYLAQPPHPPPDREHTSPLITSQGGLPILPMYIHKHAGGTSESQSGVCGWSGPWIFLLQSADVDDSAVALAGLGGGAARV